MLKNYFTTAWRSIWKNKTTSFINIAGLSVGMTAAVLILLWVQNETSYDNYKDRGRIYRLTTRIPDMGWVWETTPLLLADAIKKEIPGVEKTTRIYTSGLPVFSIKGQEFYARNCAYVDNDWFSVFNERFIEGNAAGFNENPFSVILSDAEAKKYFGSSSSALGQTIRIDTADYIVRAVVADAPINSSFQYGVFMPINALLTNPQLRANDEQWNNANYITFIKIIPGNTTEAITKQINQLLKKKSNDAAAAPVGMIALADMHFETEIQNSAFPHGNKKTVYIFSFLGFLLLLIACINYVNLSTAKASLRAKEVSIRKISGANRLHLFFQFIAESLLISLLALVTTVLLAQICLPFFNQLTDQNFSLSLSSVSLWKVLGLTLATAVLLNSIYPALVLSSFKPLNVFRGNSILKVKDISFRKALVVLQFTISVMLITCTIVIYRQLQFIQHENPGYNRSQVMSFYLPPTVHRESRSSAILAIKEALLSQSSIENVAVASQPIFNIGSMCSECADWPGHDTSYKPKIAQLSADASFLATLQLQMKEGRWFRDGDGVDRKSFILNETAVKDFHLAVPATGQPFIFKGDTGQIIGVVKDFVYKSMHQKTGPLVVFNNPNWRNQFIVRIKAKNTAAALAGIETAWKKFLPGNPFEYNFMDDSFSTLYKKDQQTSLLILVFAVIAIVISAMGLFSLAAFAATQRTKEIGIRKVLGASVAGITALLSKEFVQLVCLAILLATPLAAWLMQQWLQDFAYRVELSWWMFTAAGLCALFIALFTISFQAIKAAKANPAKSLRTE